MSDEVDIRISQLIADKLANGLYHPGNIQNDQAPMTIRLPMFRTIGMAPEVYQQVELTVRLIAEGIVHAIHTDGKCDIVPREDVK